MASVFDGDMSVSSARHDPLLPSTARFPERIGSLPLLLLLLDNQAIVFAIDTDVIDGLLAVSRGIAVLGRSPWNLSAADLDFFRFAGSVSRLAGAECSLVGSLGSSWGGGSGESVASSPVRTMSLGNVRFR